MTDFDEDSRTNKPSMELATLPVNWRISTGSPWLVNPTHGKAIGQVARVPLRRGWWNRLCDKKPQPGERRGVVGERRGVSPTWDLPHTSR
jgi:hypothetical protein